MTKAPLCIDLFCGMGGWAEGFLAEGWRVIGFDIVRWAYPGELVILDVRRLVPSQLRRVDMIVASPPCQEFSYRAMPFGRARSLPPPDTSLFWKAFELRDRAQAMTGRRIPLVVENVRGAQRWVGDAAAHYGSYYLWGDVPALLPKAAKDGVKVPGLPNYFGHGFNSTAAKRYRGSWFHGSPKSGSIAHSGSEARKLATAQISRVPLALARWIARCYFPVLPSSVVRDCAMTCAS